MRWASFLGILIIGACSGVALADPDADTLCAKLRSAQSLNASATAEIEEGHYAEGMVDFRRALQLLENSAADQEHQNLQSRGTWLAERAKANNGIGVAHSAFGEYGSAIARYENAIADWLAASRQTKPPPDVYLGFYRSHLNLVKVYLAEGRFTITIPTDNGGIDGPIATHCDNLIDMAAARFGDADAVLIPFYNTAAELHLRADKLDLAEQHATKSRALSDKHGDVLGNIAAGHFLAMVYYRRGQWTEAESIWTDLLEECHRQEDALWTGRILQRLGDTHCRLQQWEEAMADYRLAKEDLDGCGTLPVTRFNILVGMADVATKGVLTKANQEQLEEAINYLQEAVRIVEVVASTTTGGAAHRDRFYAQFVGGQEFLVQVLLRRFPQQPAQALFVADRWHAYLSAAELRGVSKNPFAGLDPATQQDVLNRLNRLRSQRRDLLEQLMRRKGNLEALRDVESRILTTWNDIYDADPCRAPFLQTDLSGESSTSKATNARQPDTAILCYSLGTESSHLWLIDNDGVHYHPLVVSARDAANLQLAKPGPLTRSMAADLVKEYLTVIRDKGTAAALARGHAPMRGPEPLPPRTLEDTPRKAISLAHTLIPVPIRDRIESHLYRRLVIIPDGVLHHLPFHGLLLDDGEKAWQFALDRFPPISYAPSLRVLEVLQTRKSLGSHKKQALVFGGLGLEGSEQECARVNGILRRCGIDVANLIRRQAVEEDVRAALPKARIVHFADHAHYTSRYDNLFGCLELLPQADRPGRQDGRLEIHEIQGLDLRGCELVVLSACETGLGSQRYVETGNSLARAFLVAGATRVVASFWKVNDESAVDLMDAFYRPVAEAIDDGKPIDYAAALHAAMKEVRNRDETRSPYHWAPFGLIGPGLVEQDTDRPPQHEPPVFQFSNASAR